MSRVILISAILAGCASPAVGLECRDGWALCDGECVDVSSDALNCGGCGLACAAGEACVAGACAGPSDDAGIPPGDAGPADAGAPDAGPPPPTGCGIGELECDGVCRDVLSDPTRCGACDAACAVGELCVDGACAPSCPATRVMCGADCVDLSSNVRHCGTCDTLCAEGVCVSGVCETAPAGHVVVIGHDFAGATSGMQRIAGNAFFLATPRRVRAVVLEEHATSTSVVGIDAAIDAIAGERGRAWTRRVATPDGLSAALGLADVLVVYPASRATDADLIAIGQASATALTQFLERGGVVVLFDAQSAHNTGTHQLLDAAGLFGARSMIVSTADLLDVVAASDALTVGVPQRYRARGGTVRFDGMEARAVVTDGVGPVVTHQPVYR